MEIFQQVAALVMAEKSNSLFLADKDLESATPEISFSRMQAAATTGPARGPRPASSTPAIFLYNLSIYRSSLLFS